MSKKIVPIILLAGLLAGCTAYKQNIMFKPGENFVSDPIKSKAQETNRNYLIQKNDFLDLEIYTNNGEKLIDPNPELSQSQQNINNTNQIRTQYLVDLNGVAKFPMVGEIKLEGLSLRQSELLLQNEYEKFFKSPFVTLKFNNKRVIVLGAPGGQVLPLLNENLTLAEVLAMAKGVNNDGKAHNIRVLRGEQVFLVDFQTLEGFHKGNMIIEPGDIVYVEPFRKPIAEGFRDYGFILTMLVTITTFVTLLQRNP